MCRTWRVPVVGLLDSAHARRRGRGRRWTGRPVPGLRAGLPRRLGHGHRRRPSRSSHRRRGRNPLTGHQHGGRSRPVAVPAQAAARTTRPCWAGWTPTGWMSARRVRPLRICSRSACAPTRTSGTAPSPQSGPAAFARRRWSRSPPEDAASLFPPLGPVHRVLHAPSAARIDGRGMAAALASGRGTRGVEFVAGAVTGIEAGRTAPSLRSGLDGTRSNLLRRAGRCGRRLDVGHGRVARMPSARGTDQGSDRPPRGGRDRRGTWPIVQPLLSHYLVPWPGGRVACGGTFETGAGFSVGVTAAGLHELLRECLTWRPASPRPPTSRPASGCGPPRRTTMPWSGPAGLAQRLCRHRPRGQRLLQRPVLEPAPGHLPHRRPPRGPARSPFLQGFDPDSLRLTIPPWAAQVREICPCSSEPCIARNRRPGRPPSRSSRPHWPAPTSSGSTSTTRTHDGVVADPPERAVQVPSRWRWRRRNASINGPAWTTTTTSSIWSARGADPDKKGNAEIHCFWTDRYVVTVHRGDCAAIAAGPRPLARAHHATRRRLTHSWSSSISC